MQPTIKLEGADELRKYLKKASDDHVKKVKAEVYATALEIRDQAILNLKALEAWDTGHLATTVVVDRTNNGLGSEIGSTAPYAPYVEHGAKPHFPPPDALEDWARRHGFDSAWPICLAISKRGIKAQPFLFPAFLSHVNEFFDRLKGIFK